MNHSIQCFYPRLIIGTTPVGTPARVISPVAYGGTPGSRHAFSLGHGLSPVRLSSLSGMGKLNLPFANITKCNDELVRTNSDAIKSTQELKQQLSSSYESVRK